TCCAPGGTPSDDPDHRANARAGGHRAGGRKEICAVHCYVESPAGGRRIKPVWLPWTAHNVVYCLDRSIASSLSGGRNWPRRTLGGTNDATVSNFSAGSARK